MSHSWSIFGKMSEKNIKVGTRVRLIGKDDLGTVVFVGTTLFQTGKWIGVELDEPKGKNNGTVQGKSYFSCKENHGVFVRVSQLQLADGSPSGDDSLIDDSSSSFYGSESNLASAEKVDKKASRMSMMKASNVKYGFAGAKPRVSLGRADSSKSLAEPKTKTASKTKLPTSSSKSDLSSFKQSDIFHDASTPVKPDSLANIQPVSLLKNESVELPARMQVIEGASTPVSRVSAADIGALSNSINARMEDIHQLQEIEGLKSEIKDLQEKLETLKIKRGQDVEKLKEFEKVKIQLEKMQEYKTKMQESQNDLQRQLQAAKKEASDLSEQFIAYKEEMTEAQESIEMATLDKEMAEEKCETLQLELQQWKEKAEELSLDLQILKEDLATPADGSFSAYEKKQLEQQNERLKEAIVKMKELANLEKQESMKAQKTVEALTAEKENLRREKERAEKQVEKLEMEAIDLKEQVDVAQGAEEMVERLTDKTLLLEEQLKKLEEEKEDLEALCEMNDELQESAKETELELRDKVDQSNMKLNEANRKVESLNDAILDYQSTIVKFRELVAQLQNKIKEQSDNSSDNSSKPIATPTIEFDFKTKFAETKATAKAIDLELRKLDVEQANKHVSYLCSFMPENFFKIGGDHDAILTLLFMPRMISKCDILMSHVREKFGVPDEMTRDDVVKTHKSVGFGFANNLVYNLSLLQGYFRQFDNVLGTCGVDMLLKIGTLLPEIVIYEKTIDTFVDLLRKDQLDETISLESLEKTIIYFQHLYSVHFAQHKPNCNELMNLQMQILTAATNCINTDISSLRLALQPSELDVTVTNLLNSIEEQNNELKTAAKKIRRRIPDNTNSANPMSFSKEVQGNMAEKLESLGKALKTIRFAASASGQLLAVLEGLSSKQLEEVFLKATEKVFGKPDADLKSVITECAQMFKQISVAMENGEYDFDGTPDKLPLPPVVHRANAVKSEFADVENLKNTVEVKDKTMQELKTQLKNKQDDLGQSVLRMQVLEKKLETLNKEADDKIDKMQQKLDEANMELRKKEKEHEDGMDALQADIDNLEAEKTELQKKLKELSKKSLFASLAKQMPSPENSEAMETPVKEGSIASREVASLRETIKFLSLKNAELVGEKMKDQFCYLPNLDVPKKAAEIDEDLQQLQREAKELTAKTQKVLIPKLIDITKCKKGVKPQGMDNPLKQAAVREAELAAIKRELDEFEAKMAKQLAFKKKGGHVRTDFGLFASPSYLRAMNNQLVGSKKLMGTISIPCPPGQGCSIPLEINANQLNEIHSRLCCC